MINIERKYPAPKSLDTSGIRQYLDDLQAYKANQALPKPKCTESYRNADLFTAFEECFFNKCYLTEQSFITSWSMDIEHFVPQTERPDLKYTWDNLYPANHDANMMKPRNTPSGGYLDPCNPEHDVERDILYFIDFEGDRVHFRASDESNIRANNTAQLLEKLHNGHTYDTRQKTQEIRSAIQKKYVKVLETINKWRKATQERNSQAEFEFERILKGLLSRRSSYTMLLRSMEAVKDLPVHFLD